MQSQRRIAQSAASVAAAVTLVALMWATIATVGSGLPIRQANSNLSTPEIRQWWALWWVFGSAAVLALAHGMYPWLLDPGWRERLRGIWLRGSDRAFVLGMAVLAFTLSSVVCWATLGGRHLVVDESGYRFMAQVLASGRLYVDSYPDAGFYDRGFMINDGKFYAQYFLGWPAMLAPFARFGLEPLANPFWFAVTVPAVFGVLRRLVGKAWARAGTLLFATAPLAVMGAATQMSHIACTFWLAWAAWFALRTEDDDAPAWTSAGLAVAFCGAFFVRPTTALGIGGPFLVHWWLTVRKQPGRGRAILAFLLPALGLAGLFLAINQAQNGSPFVVGYSRSYAFSAETPFLKDRSDTAIAGMRFDSGWRAVTSPFIALFRHDFAALGWPTSFLFVPFALRARGGRLFLASAIGMLGVHLFLNAGIAAYGPVHFFELLLPILVLNVIGMRALASAPSPEWVRAAVVALVAALWIAAPAGYTGWRLSNLARIGRQVEIPYALVDHLGESVVFVPLGQWLPHCVDEVHHFHVSRPDNPPDLDARVLWVNHVSVRHDQGFLALHYPDREGYILDWDATCAPKLLPLAALGADDFPGQFKRRSVYKPFDHLLRYAPKAEPQEGP